MALPSPVHPRGGPSREDDGLSWGRSLFVSRSSSPTLASPPSTPSALVPDQFEQQHQQPRLFWELLALAWVVLVVDLYQLGIDGESNSRALSLIDSFAHCASWVSSGDNVQLHFVFSVLTKYGGGTLISFLLHVTPTVLSGWMHNVPFFFALVLAHLFPSVSRMARSRYGLWRVFFVVSGSLFKSRKLRFAIRNAAALGGPWFVLVIGILSMELTAWLAWGCRRILRGSSFFGDQKVIRATLFSPRMILTFLAIWASYVEAPAVFLILVLLVHKATKPSSENAVY